MAGSSRMTSFQRREQLIAVGRSLFASKGFEAVSVEEIAAHAKVSKPIVYEHFGGKEGLYAVIVDREMRALTEALTGALAAPTEHPRQIVERTALALLTYIEENAEGFRVLSRDSPSTDPSGSFSSLLGDISMRVEDLLTATFKRRRLSAKGVPYYAQMLVGMTVFTGQYWANRRKVGKEQLAAYIVDLAWHGLSHLDSKPTLVFEGSRARRGEDRGRKDAGDSPSADGASSPVDIPDPSVSPAPSASATDEPSPDDLPGPVSGGSRTTAGAEDAEAGGNSGTTDVDSPSDAADEVLT